MIITMQQSSNQDYELVCKTHGLLKPNQCIEEKYNKQDYLRVRCKSCKQQQHDKWVKDNPDKVKGYNDKWRKNNVDKIAKYYQKNRQSYIERVKRSRFGGLRESVIQRDNFKCVDCKLTRTQHKIKYGVDITVNHVDGSGRNNLPTNNSTNNLETLCLKCHGSKDSKRYWHGRPKL